jgi:hypothetical protein
MAQKRQGKPVQKLSTPLDAKKRELVDQENQIRAEMERRKKLIEDAPRIAEELQRRRREEHLRRKSRGVTLGSPALSDPRYLEANTASPMPRLRKDRNQGMFMFFVLLVTLLAVLYWVYIRLLRMM